MMKELKFYLCYMFFLISIISSYYVAENLVYTKQTELTDETRNCFIVDIISEAHWDGVTSDGSPTGGHFYDVIGIYRSNFNTISIGRFEASGNINIYKMNSVQVPKNDSLVILFLFIVCIIYCCMYLVLIRYFIYEHANFNEYHTICEKLIENNEENFDNTIDKNGN